MLPHPTGWGQQTTAFPPHHHDRPQRLKPPEILPDAEIVSDLGID